MNIKHIAAGITAAVIMGAMSITAFAAQKESPLQMAAIAIDDSLSTAWGENRNVSYTEDENKIYIIIWDDGVNEKTIETRSKCSTPTTRCSIRSASRTDI